MKSTGVVRQLDQLGRVVIPIEMRRTMGIEEKDNLEFFVDGDAIVLRKFQPGCIFCHETEELVPFKDKMICEACL